MRNPTAMRGNKRKAKVVDVDIYGLCGREVQPTKEHLGQEVTVLRVFLDEGMRDHAFYLCRLADGTEIEFADYEIELL